MEYKLKGNIPIYATIITNYIRPDFSQETDMLKLSLPIEGHYHLKKEIIDDEVSYTIFIHDREIFSFGAITSDEKAGILLQTRIDNKDVLVSAPIFDLAFVLAQKDFQSELYGREQDREKKRKIRTTIDRLDEQLNILASYSLISLFQPSIVISTDGSFASFVMLSVVSESLTPLSYDSDLLLNYVNESLSIHREVNTIKIYKIPEDDMINIKIDRNMMDIMVANRFRLVYSISELLKYDSFPTEIDLNYLSNRELRIRERLFNLSKISDKGLLSKLRTADIITDFVFVMKDYPSLQAFLSGGEKIGVPTNLNMKLSLFERVLSNRVDAYNYVDQRYVDVSHFDTEEIFEFSKILLFLLVGSGYLEPGTGLDEDKYSCKLNKHLLLDRIGRFIRFLERVEDV